MYVGTNTYILTANSANNYTEILDDKVDHTEACLKSIALCYRNTFSKGLFLIN